MTITRKANSGPQIRSTLLTGPEEVAPPISTPRAIHFGIRTETSPDSIRQADKAPVIQSDFRITGERDGIWREKNAETPGDDHLHLGWTGLPFPVLLNLAAGGLGFPSAGGRTTARLSSVWHSAGKPLPGGPASQGATPVGVPTWTRLRAREGGPRDA